MGKFGGFSIPSINIPPGISGPAKSAASQAKNTVKSKLPEIKQFASQALSDAGIKIPDVSDIKSMVLSQIPEADLNEMKAMGITEDAIVEAVKEQMPHIPSVDELKDSAKNFKMPTVADIKKYASDKITETKESIELMRDLKKAMDEDNLENFQIPEKYLTGE